MAQDVRKFIPSITPQTVLGNWETTCDIIGDLRQVIVQPQSASNSFDFGIIDDNDYMIYVVHNHTGPLVTGDLNIVMFPGLKRLIIQNATKDEIFKIKLVYQV